jgi:hypothetical protein
MDAARISAWQLASDEAPEPETIALDLTSAECGRSPPLWCQRARKHYLACCIAHSAYFVAYETGAR